MRVAILCTEQTDKDLESAIIRQLSPLTTEILCCRTAADELVARVAESLRIPLRQLAPSEEKALVDLADEVMIFWNGENDRGGRIAAECVRKGRPVRLVPLSSL